MAPKTDHLLDLTPDFLDTFLHQSVEDGANANVAVSAAIMYPATISSSSMGAPNRASVEARKNLVEKAESHRE